MTSGYTTPMTSQSNLQLPQHWAHGWAHCAFTPQAPIVYGAGQTILLAEKDATLLKLGTVLLKKLNYRALTANNAADILVLCRTEKIEVIIFDVEIDQQLTEAEKVRAGLKRLQPATKILLFTYHDVSLGLSSYPPISGLPVLTKPFTVQSFSQAIHQCLGAGEQGLGSRDLCLP